MIKKTAKNQKPVGLDIHLKYRCPNHDCGYIHWISLLEAQTQNFKIVCDCGIVFKPKKINKVQILYAKKNPVKSKIPVHRDENQTTNIVNSPSETILKKAVSYLTSLGFTEPEAINALNKTYSKQPTNNISTWIKNTLLEIKSYG